MAASASRTGNLGAASVQRDGGQSCQSRVTRGQGGKTRTGSWGGASPWVQGPRTAVTGGSRLREIPRLAGTSPSRVHCMSMAVPSALEDPVALSCPDLPGWLPADEKCPRLRAGPWLSSRVAGAEAVYPTVTAAAGPYLPDSVRTIKLPSKHMKPHAAHGHGFHEVCGVT